MIAITNLLFLTGSNFPNRTQPKLCKYYRAVLQLIVCASEMDRLKDEALLNNCTFIQWNLPKRCLLCLHFIINSYKLQVDIRSSIHIADARLWSGCTFGAEWGRKQLWFVISAVSTKWGNDISSLSPTPTLTSVCLSDFCFHSRDMCVAYNLRNHLNWRHLTIFHICRMTYWTTWTIIVAAFSVSSTAVQLTAMNQIMDTMSSNTSHNNNNKVINSTSSKPQYNNNNPSNSHQYRD